MVVFWVVGLPVAAVLHGVLLVLVLVTKGGADHVIPPTEVMEVAMITLHRDADVLPEKVMVAPPRVTGDMGVDLQPEIDPDQMVLDDPDAEDKEGEDKEPEDEEARQERRDDLIAKLDEFEAPKGPETNLPTDPNSDVVDPRELYLSGDGTNPADPELGAYIRDCKEEIMRHWHVLPSVANEDPDLTVVIWVQIDDGGKIKRTQIVDNSGNRQYDSATYRAVKKMGRLPPPPTEKIRGYAEGGVFIRFKASDKVF